MALYTSHRSGVSTSVIAAVVTLLIIGAALAGYLVISGPSSSGRASSSGAGRSPTSVATTSATTTMVTRTGSTTAESSSNLTVFSKQNESSPGDDDFPTWSPDGSRLFFLRLTSSGQQNLENESLWVLYLNGTEQGPLLQVDTNTTLITGASWSPDGEDIVLGTASYTSPFGPIVSVSSSQLVSINVKTASVRTIATIENSSIIDPVQLADGTVVFLSGGSASASAITPLYLYTIGGNGTRPTQLAVGGNGITSYCVSPARDKVAVLYGTVFSTNGVLQIGTNISVIEFPSLATTTFGWYSEQAFCSWSSDGSAIFTSSFSGSQREVYFATADASGNNKLLFGGQQLISPPGAPLPQSIFVQPLCQQVPPAGGSFPPMLGYGGNFVMLNVTINNVQGQTQVALAFWQTDAHGGNRQSVLNVTVTDWMELLGFLNANDFMLGCWPQYSVSAQGAIAYDMMTNAGYLELIVTKLP